ncbi:MAG TPA: hypothetical protein VK184_12625 [Nostocaceae cyanobacterium]|nr:hypothetical protein [Nostocaceae cyanobacterium]
MTTSTYGRDWDWLFIAGQGGRGRGEGGQREREDLRFWINYFLIFTQNLIQIIGF